jgi:hypothetical protein
MKTDDLIDMLARGPDVRVDAHRWRRFLVPALLGLAACVLLMQLLLGTRHDIGRALLLPAFWIKFCFALVLSVVGALAVPVFIAALVAMKRRAPTRLRTAGAAAGLASGATAAMVYCLHCPEMSPAFVGVWYVLGIAAMTLVGALIGPKVLSW